MLNELCRRWIRCSKGNFAVVTALAAVPVIGAAGVAVDYIRSNRAETQVQAALDSAVLAGVSAAADQETVASTYFAANFPLDGVEIKSSEFKKTGSTNIKLRGTADLLVPTSFSRVIGIDSMTLSIHATAEASDDPGNLLCILTLSPNENQSLLANSGADVNASGCEIHVKSVANPAAIFNAGTTIKSKRLCIEGTQYINNGGSFTNLETGCNTMADPYAGKIPAPASTACDYNNMNYSGNVTINPGVYCGWQNFNSGTNVTLNPGLYVIKSGGWNVNGGQWTGNGVTFYYADTSKIQFNSAVKATLKAPTTGTYKDILMAEAAGLSATQFIFDDNLGFDMTGILYLPSREVVFNSGTTTRSHKMTAVMRKVIFNSTRWNLTPYNGGGSGGVANARLTD